MIYVLEGADGTGKTTLANYIASQTKGHILHCSFNPLWDMEEYHKDILETAIDLNEYQDVVIDRWIISELVYGNTFRGGPSYNIFDFLWEHSHEVRNIKWIYCRNDNAVKNHRKLKKKRNEMFDDMTKVVLEYEKAIKLTKDLMWDVYDFDKTTTKDFWKEMETLYGVSRKDD